MMRKIISIFVLSIFIISNSTLSFAQTQTIAGTIESVVSIGGGQYQITLRSEQGALTFLVDSSTLIQAVIAVKEVKVGNRILPLPKAGRKATKGFKSPFENLPPAVKDALGLPNILSTPDIPVIPSIPQVPDVPQKLEVPQAPEVPQGPAIPEIPQVPQAPGKTGPAPGAAAPAGEGAAPPMAPTGEAPQPQGMGEMAQPEAPEAELPEPPAEAMSSVADQAPISRPTPTFEKPKGRTVAGLEETNEGVMLKLETMGGETEEVLFDNEEKVVQLLNVDDLELDMKVNIEFVEDLSGKYVQRVVVV